MANETINDPRLEEGVWTTGPDGELIPDYESTFPTINEGEVVNGTVVRVDKDEVLVDIGYKSEGVIPVSELSIRRSVNPADEVTLGDEIDAGKACLAGEGAARIDHADAVAGQRGRAFGEDAMQRGKESPFLDRLFQRGLRCRGCRANIVNLEVFHRPSL